jgi:hypothetical protein
LKHRIESEKGRGRESEAVSNTEGITAKDIVRRFYVYAKARRKIITLKDFGREASIDTTKQ